MIKKTLTTFILIILCISCDKVNESLYGIDPSSLSIIFNDREGNCLLPEIPEGSTNINLEFYQIGYEINGEKQNVIDEKPNKVLTVYKEEKLGKNIRSLQLFTVKFTQILCNFARNNKEDIFHIKVTLMCPDIFKDENEHYIEANLKYVGDTSIKIMDYIEGCVFVDGIQTEYIEDELYKVNLNIKQRP